jgi:hypothetical protein
MTEEKFNGAKEILESIQRAEQAIKKINRLIESNNLECKIFSLNDSERYVDYELLDTEQIIKLLEYEKEKITNDLIILKKFFSEL